MVCVCRPNSRLTFRRPVRGQQEVGPHEQGPGPDSRDPGASPVTPDPRRLNWTSASRAGRNERLLVGPRAHGPQCCKSISKLKCEAPSKGYEVQGTGMNLSTFSFLNKGCFLLLPSAGHPPLLATPLPAGHASASCSSSSASYFLSLAGLSAFVTWSGDVTP